MIRTMVLSLVVAASAAKDANAATPRPHVSGRAVARMAAIPRGTYEPLYGSRGLVTVNAFRLDKAPVTRGEFVRFVRDHADWRRSAAARGGGADAGYLADWRSDLDPGDERQPVTDVSWNAASAYCAAQGKRLPTTDEWEYVARASETKRDATHDAAFTARLVALYTARPRRIGITNVYGVTDMHGHVWEWTEDDGGSHESMYHSHMSGASMDDNHASCAAAALGAGDLTNYPAFLRSALRAGLTRMSTLDGLGFRCAA